MKDYLNNNERLQLLFFKKYVDNTENMINDWDERKNLTKEEHKALKTALTLGCKVFESILSRQDQTTIKIFRNSMINSSINLDDNYAIKAYKKKLKTNIDACYEENRDYYKLIELILDQKCKGCKKEHKECEFCKEFINHCIPESSAAGMGYNENCPYSY